MLLKLLLADWMAFLLTVIVFGIIVLNMERLGVIRMIALRLSMIALLISIVLCAFTNATKEKIGATCEDGWESESIGSGTCSHHGGVESWEYEYWFEK